MTSDAQRFRETFAPSEEIVNKLVPDLLEFITEKSDVPFTNRFMGELIFREILINSVRYGSPNGESITVEVEILGEDIAVRLLDHGPHFSLNPQTPPDSTEEGGRGLWILQQHTKNLRLHSDPKVLEMHIPIQSQDQENLSS